MQISTETISKTLASSRNYISTVVGFVGGVGAVSAANDKGLMDSINEIYTGLSMVVHGATSFWQILLVSFPIIGIVMGQIAKRSASVPNQAAAVKAAVADPNTTITPEVKQIIVTTGAEAAKS